MRLPYSYMTAFQAARATAREADEEDFEVTFDLTPEERRRYYERKKEEKA